MSEATIQGIAPLEMTNEELIALPVSVDLLTAGRAFGMGRTKSYELAKRDEFPCRVLKIGPAYRVARADLLRVLGIEVSVSLEPSA